MCGLRFLMVYMYKVVLKQSRPKAAPLGRFLSASLGANQMRTELSICI